MPIYRLKNSGNWRSLSEIYRLKNNGSWRKIENIYRLKKDGVWKKIHSSGLQTPQVSVQPVLSNQIGSTTDFKNADVLTLTRGQWTKTDSSFNPVSYQLKIQSSPDLSSWTDVSTGTGTSIEYTIPIASTRVPSLYFRGEVIATNVNGSNTYRTTPVRSRINLSVTKPIVSTSPNVITVSWITNPANSSLNIQSQTLQIIANQQYTFNGNTYNIGDVVYSASVSPGTQTNVNISLSGTNMTSPISYKARVIVVAKDSAETTVTSELSDAFITNALTPPTPTSVTWTRIGGVKTWSIFFTGGSGPFFQTTYAFSPAEQTTTGFEASGSFSPITYTGLTNPTNDVSIYWFVRSSNQLDSNTSNDISLWSAGSIEFRPRSPFNVSVSVAPTSGTAGSTTYTATALASGTPTPDITYDWQFFDSEISGTFQSLGVTTQTYQPEADHVSRYGSTRLICKIKAENLMDEVFATSNEVSVSAPFVPPFFPFFPSFVVNYTLTVNCNGGAGCPSSGTHTGSYTIPSTNPLRDGFTFNGYDATCSGSAIGRYTAGQTINCTGTIVLTASWTANAVAPVNTASPVVSPTSGAVGTIFSCSTGTWTGTPTPTFTFQWQTFESGFGWINISGATSSNYTSTTSVANSNIKCIVTASNSAGSASAESNVASVGSAPPFFPPFFPFFPFFPPFFPFFPTFTPPFFPFFPTFTPPFFPFFPSFATAPKRICTAEDNIFTNCAIGVGCEQGFGGALC
jgi:hypothetical protein